MATNLPIPLLSKLLVYCKLYGGNRVAGGGNTVTWTLIGDLSFANGNGAYDDFRINARRQNADVTPTDSQDTVMVAGRRSNTLTISEIQASDGSTFLIGLSGAYDYIKVVALVRPENTSSGGTFYAGMGTIADADAGISELTGKNVFRVTTDPMGYPYYIGPTLPAAFT